jgi:hypothetical protein
MEDSAGLENEGILDEIVDIEEYAKRGEVPPLARGYRFKVNGEPYEVNNPLVKGRDVLRISGRVPPEDYTLRLYVAGQRPRKIALDEVVDLRAQGVEKFKALPRDQTEG